MFTCIGKRKAAHGTIVPCTNTSEVPSNSARPEWGFLCAECLGTQYGPRPLNVDLPDFDYPDLPEQEEQEFQLMEESEAEELEGIRELELDIEF